MDLKNKLFQEAGGMNLCAYCYGNPLNLYDPDGLWAVRPERMLTNGEIGDALNDGFFAILDGAIPFWDPFANSGKYGRCESEVGVSQAAGGIARDAALSALVPNIGAWAKNPVMYELGSLGSGRALKQFQCSNRF